MEKTKTETAIFACGCFWGVQYYFEKANGVLSTRVGYTGGHKQNPTYEEVCAHETGHYEAIEVTYDSAKTNYEELAKLFFSIHDYSQDNGQGPDLGEQYRSAIFYLNEEQRAIAEKLIKILQDRGDHVATKLLPTTEFYPAEDYHQFYYDKTGHEPYCHRMRRVF